MLLSVVTFSANDPSLNHVVSKQAEVSNQAGLFGAYTAGFLNDVFGIGAYIWPLVFGALGASCVSPAYTISWWRWCGLFLLTICLLVVGAAWDLSLGDITGGGMIGSTLHSNSSYYLSPGGSGLVWFFIFLVGVQLTFNFSWFSVGALCMARIRERILQKKQDEEHKPEIVTHGQELASLPFHKRILAGLKQKKPGKGSDFWRALRDKLGNIRPAKEPMPEIYPVEPEETPAASAAPAKDQAPVAAPVAVADDDDDFFAPSAPRPVIVETASVVPADGDDEAAGAASADSGVPSQKDPGMRPAASAPAEGAPAPQPSPASPKAAGSTPAAPSGRPTAAPEKRPRAPIPLPSLDLLSLPSKDAPRVRREDLEARGKALMECLKDFDIQSELVRITPGPVVTMYEVRPAPGIRVNRIANLSDDLALALKAIAVRIQAPIPGSDTVGIEIPNDDREIVNFRELASSEDFRKGCGPLTMILGKDIAGRPFMADLTRMPHLLVAGATGAGKSVCLNGILLSLLYRTQPEEMRLLLVDPKRIEMAMYADEPHLIHPVVTEMSEAKNALDWAVHEMDQRYEAMARMGVRNVASYNQRLAGYNGQLPPDLADLEPLPYLVIVIDELADLMMTAAREVETSIVRLAQLARAAGIHMILATQRPSVDVVTGLIKANFPCRISFQVTSRHDSRTILDQAGAEHLLGRGDMLFKPSGGRLQRLHGPFLSDEEVQNVVGYWKHHLVPSYKVSFADWNTDGAAGGNGGGSGAGDVASDPLYAEVQAFVTEQGRVSISLIQRRFKIGFNRAANMVEQLEADGIIGPADGSKPRAVVK
ncbi:DNA translocase FtsK [Desulfovibrio piger]|uniref:Cell division protein FtsK n=1 Tax=Desulfovibrio piger TaxID=901 RepID=A0A1K1LCW9_9BACT|nr:Cell division protein FtsK [Desulfovibrio piger]